MRKLLILGATGSIGTTCLNSIESNNLDIKLTGVSAYSNSEKLENIKAKFNIENSMLFKDHSPSEIKDFIAQTDADIVLNAIAGADGLFATLASLDGGKDVALANKESVVMGGNFLFDYARKRGRKLIPVDSEHSAIYNLLKNQKAESLVITASGGPFIDRKDTSFVTLEEALCHPTWKMGKKITIDSATLANKGLEVIEASYLFNIPYDKIEVTIHRQSIVHSMIRTKEGAVYAQLSPPDMALPIISAISDNTLDLRNIVRPLSFKDLTLTFEVPDLKQFPLLAIAYDVLKHQHSYPIAYNAANEEAVNAFISGHISFNSIAKVVKSVLDNDFSMTSTSYDEIKAQDRIARELAMREICSIA